MNPEHRDSYPTFLVAAAGPAAAGLYDNVEVPGGPRGDSGTDLRFAEDAAIPPASLSQGLATVVDLKVRIRCRLADGTYAPYFIAPRSSLGKTPLSLANGLGTIDAGYQGCLKVALRNHSEAPWRVARGDALFQLIRPDLTPVRVAVVSEGHDAFAEETARAAGGFGSTGAGGAR